jgi:hypothetical protein
LESYCNVIRTPRNYDVFLTLYVYTPEVYTTSGSPLLVMVPASTAGEFINVLGKSFHFHLIFIVNTGTGTGVHVREGDVNHAKVTERGKHESIPEIKKKDLNKEKD